MRVPTALPLVRRAQDASSLRVVGRRNWAASHLGRNHRRTSQLCSVRKGRVGGGPILFNASTSRSHTSLGCFHLQFHATHPQLISPSSTPLHPFLPYPILSYTGPSISAPAPLRPSRHHTMECQRIFVIASTLAPPRPIAPPGLSLPFPSHHIMSTAPVTQWRMDRLQQCLQTSEGVDL